jgi:hypothetical protein
MVPSLSREAACHSATHEFNKILWNLKFHMRSDNKARELATVCLSWQQWTETSAGLMTLAY